MICAEFEDRLDDYLDGSLAEPEFQELELHLAGCGACREQERSLRSLLLQAAALPREQTPRRDLWPEVAARLEPRDALSEARRALRNGGWLPAALGAAAAVLLAVATLLRPPEPAPAPEPQALEPGSTALRAGSSSEPTEVLAAEREYAQAATTLLAALHARRERLSPETLAAVENNLQSIDDALAQIRAALERDPGSGALNHLLASTHQRKLKVLQRIVRLSRI